MKPREGDLEFGEFFFFFLKLLSFTKLRQISIAEGECFRKDTGVKGQMLATEEGSANYYGLDKLRPTSTTVENMNLNASA